MEEEDNDIAGCARVCASVLMRFLRVGRLQLRLRQCLRATLRSPESKAGSKVEANKARLLVPSETTEEDEERTGVCVVSVADAKTNCNGNRKRKTCTGERKENK